MNRPTHTSTLPAMSTTVAVISVGIPESRHDRAMNQIADDIEVWQQIFSRFRPESTLCRLNASAGHWTGVEDVFIDLLETARDAVIATQGRFNPAIIGALEAHGYDRTIEMVQAHAHSTRELPDPVDGTETWAMIEFDRIGKRVRLPQRLRIDFGGIAKGALADWLADRYGHWPGGAISIGGDMRVWGDPPDGECWRVGIEHPLDPQHDIASMEVHEGCAIATSSRTQRAWQTVHGSAHHLIDPFTGAPVAAPLLATTVCAPTAVAAEVIAKNLMVASAHGPLTADMLLDAHWALTISDTLALARIDREAA